MHTCRSLLPLFLLCLLLGGSFHVWSQDTAVNIVSPTAASLGKYGDFPIGYHTGTPNIDIPLYTVKAGKLSLPVSLSYHASGLKVQEEASWVGAGWALNAGGVITRTVISQPDDRGYNNSHAINCYYSDYGYDSYLFKPGSGIGSTTDGMVEDDLGFVSGYKDGEPDLYFFNFGGYTGKFYFNDDRTPIFVPEEDFKVQTDLATGNTGFNGFIITTPDGTKYYFGATGNSSPITPYEVSIPTTLQGGPSYSISAISAWYLNKIVSADGVDSITFTYAQENYSDYTISMYPVRTGGMIPTNFLVSGAPQGYNLVKNFINGVRLSQINFPNGSLSFIPVSSPRIDLGASLAFNQTMYNAPNTYAANNPYPAYALGAIQLTDNNGFCKKYTFNYGYFYDGSALDYRLNQDVLTGVTTDQYRLRLDSIQETSCDGTASVPPYKFSYYGEPVPRKLSLGIDHWGFSNGKSGNATLTPTITIQAAAPTGGGVSQFEQVQGGDRDAHWPAMRGGALQQISYPTGGNTRFVFQPHNTYVSYSVPIPLKAEGSSFAESRQTQPIDTFITSSGTTSAQVIVGVEQGQNVAVNYLIEDASGHVLFNFAASSTKTDTAWISLVPNTTYLETMTGNTGFASASLVEWGSTSVSGNDTVGGLRIDSMIQNDGVSPGNAMVTTYDYGGEHSTGILYSRPVYAQPFSNSMISLVFGPSGVNSCGTPNGTVSYFMLSPGSVMPMATTQGNHIGYNQVKVTQSGNGSSIYQYYGSNTWDYLVSDVCTRSINIGTCSSSLPDFPFAPVPFEFMRGELKYEQHINEAGKTLKDIYYFPVYQPDSVLTPGMIATSGPPFSVITFYQLQSGYKIQDSTVSTDYDPVSGNALTITTTTYFGSRFHHQPTRRTISTSTGDLLSTNIRYAMDFRIPACDNLVDNLQGYKMTVHNDSTSLYATLGSCTPQGGELSSCRYPADINFRRAMQLARTAYVNQRLNYLNTVATNFTAAENTADASLQPILRLRDEFVNTPIETTSWRDNYLKHAEFTTYGISTNPIGVAYPIKTRMVNLQAVSNTFSPATVSGNTIAMDSRYQDESTVYFNNGKIRQMTPHDGVTVSYLWDYQNEQPVAKVIGSTVDHVAYSSFETGNNTGAVNVNNPSGITASDFFTGKNSYNISGGLSIANLNPATTYVISLWAKNGTPACNGSSSWTNGKTTNGWTYLEKTLTGTSTININGTGGLVDEVRCYPSTAQMTTYTYSPLLGITSQCDVGNRASYYHYDALGRLQYIQDQDGNIVKTYQYHYKGQ